MDWYRVIARSPELFRRSLKVARKFQLAEVEREGESFVTSISRKHIRFLNTLKKEFGVTVSDPLTREEVVSRMPTQPGIGSVSHERYVIFGSDNQRRALRRCRRKLVASLEIPCEDAPEANAFYARVEPSLVNAFYRRVRSYKLRALEAPEDATLALVIATYIREEQEDLEMFRQLEVAEQQQEEREMLQREEAQTPGQEGDQEAAYAEATSVLLEAKAQAEAQAEELRLVAVNAEGAGSADQPVASVDLHGRVITRETLEELASKHTKEGTKEELGVSYPTLQSIMQKLGATDLEFSYFCKNEDCSGCGMFFGRGPEGRKAQRKHLLSHKGLQPSRSVVSGQTAVQPGSVSQETTPSLLFGRIQELEARASGWAAVQEEVRSLETRLAQIEEEKAQARARLEELETANPEARQAAERLAQIRELLGES